MVIDFCDVMGGHDNTGGLILHCWAFYILDCNLLCSQAVPNSGERMWENPLGLQKEALAKCMLNEIKQLTIC